MPQNVVPFLLRVCRSVNGLRRVIVLLVLASLASLVEGAEPTVKRFYELASGDASRTLRQFVEQSGEQVVYVVTKVRGVKTNPVKGEFTAREVLSRMVAETSLFVVEDRATGALMIQRTTPSRAPPAAPRASPTPSAPPLSTQSAATSVKSRRLFTVLASVFSVLVPNLSSGQAAGTDPGTAPLKDEAVQLSPFNVDTSKDFGYRRTNAVTATRIGMPTIESPLNIQVIGADFLRDIGADNIQDAFRYTSGISTDDANEFRPTVRVRGFAPSALFRDGFLRYYNFDIDGIEQIEVVKGPNAVFFGRTSPGGIINYTTKKAQFRNATSFQATLGDHAYYKGLLDSQFTLIDRRLAMRVVASKLDAESWLDKKTQEKEFVLANVTFRPSEKIELYGAIEHTDNRYRGTGFYGMVQNGAFARAKAAGTSPADESLDAWRRRVFTATQVLPPNYDGPWFPRGYSFNKNGGGSYEEGRDTAIDLQAKFEITERLNLRLSYNRLDSSAEQANFINGSPDQTPQGEIKVSKTGNGPFDPSGPVLPANNSVTTLNYGFLNVPWFMIFDRPTAPYLQGGNQVNRNRRSTYQADLTYELDAFNAKHTFVASFDQSKDRYYRPFPLVSIAGVEASGILPGWSPWFNNGPTPYKQWIDPFSVNFGSPSFGWYPLDTRTLSYSQIPDMKKLKWKYSDELGADSYYAGNRRTDTGYGLNYHGQYLGGRANLTAGVRRSETESIAYNEKGDKGSPSSTSHTTPMVGLNARVAPALVLFASFNRSFQVPSSGFEGARNPTVTNPTTKATAGGESFPVERGQGYDIGIKTDYLDNLLAGTISLFRVDREDVLVRDTAREDQLLKAGFDMSSVGNGFQRPSGLQRAEGVEADFVYTPAPNYQVLASATWTFKRSIVEPDPVTINKVRGGSYDSGIPGDTRDQNHKELAGVPEWQFGMFNKYTFRADTFKGLGLGGGVTYESSSFPDQSVDFGFRLPGVTLVDALISYEWKFGETPISFLLNVNNALDKHYYSGRVGVGAPRTWKLSSTVRF